jgi:hypothetical protein
MDFTVCIPVRNRIKMANETIKSILVNSPYDVLIIDDISNRPDSAYIQNERVKIIHNDKKSGLSSMWNQFLFNTNTEYLIFTCDKIRFQKKDFNLIENKLKEGFGAVATYLMGCVGFSKHLISKIGLFHDNFLGGGYEDTDFYNRLFISDIGLYISTETSYIDIGTGWDPVPSNEPIYNTKWRLENKTLTQLDGFNMNGVEDFEKYNNGNIKYLTWDKSQLIAPNIFNYYNGLKTIKK